MVVSYSNKVRKTRKYASLASRFKFQPVAFETGGACGPSTKLFVRQLGARMVATTGDRRDQAWLWQRLSLAVIRGNATSVLNTPAAGEHHCLPGEHVSRADNHSKQREQGREQCETEDLPLPNSSLMLALLDTDGPIAQPHMDTSRVGVDSLEEFRALYNEMQAEVADSVDRDPRADPDLARYLGPPK